MFIHCILINWQCKIRSKYITKYKAILKQFFTTCCSFGGKDLDKLFITSAYNNDKDNGSPVIKDMKINGILEADVSI